MLIIEGLIFIWGFGWWWYCFGGSSRASVFQPSLLAASAVSATVAQPAYDMAWCLDGIGVRVVSFTAMFGVRMRR